MPGPTSAVSRLAVLSLSAILTTACVNGADFKLTLRNDTDQSWLIRVEAPGGVLGDATAVRRLDPGNEGQVADWEGPPDRHIEVLDLYCNLMGVVEIATDRSAHVPGIDGLTGSVSAYNGLTDWANDPEVTGTEDCGGFLLR